MGSIVDRLIREHLFHPPKHLKNNVQYECMMGSVAYGVSSDNSDIDIYGFSIPNKEIIFPHVAGHINGFGKKPQGFDQAQQHHIKFNGKTYDMSIYSIVRYFQLCMENNPNMIDSLFVPRRCIIHSTQVGELVRENRKLFLHKGAWHKFKGYAFSQVHKMKTKKPVGKRKELVEKHGMDRKFAYHTVRLLDEVEQILTEHDIDLERNREQLKAIRRGEWSMEQVDKHFQQKEKDLEALYTKSTLQHSPDEDQIKELLLNCLEWHFGTLEKCYIPETDVNKVLADMQAIIDGYGRVNNVR
ncbi:MAG: nucleotidyltransferase [bacterium]|nr:nucleotidyltransferase [bacterium]